MRINSWLGSIPVNPEAGVNHRFDGGTAVWGQRALVNPVGKVKIPMGQALIPGFILTRAAPSSW
ncbi:MAG: hypothetical protein HKL89_02545 [Candidatus Dormibacteraeota bacterium]|nr:hypothetical protein [Candidatus Dormibacteraeota bacterium]